MRTPRRRLLTTLVLLWAVLPATPFLAAEPPQPTLALVGGRIIDCYEGPPIEDGVIRASSA